MAAAGAIGYPVVLKSTAPWLRHRSDLGGVRLDLPDADAVRGGKPTLLISLREDPAATEVAEWVREQVRARALQTTP